MACDRTHAGGLVRSPARTDQLACDGRSRAFRFHHARSVRRLCRAKPLSKGRRGGQMALKVLRAGVLSTLQDLGRWGSQRIGVPVSGAMDRYSHRLANLLVGNDETEATVEMTLVGPGFTATREVLIAVCGAEFDARVNGQPFPKARPVLVRAGSTLDFGRCRRGCRAYLAVAGGFQVDPVLGSRSTFIRGGFGGWHGRALKRGDLLPVSEPDARLFPSLHRKLSNASVQLAYPSW